MLLEQELLGERAHVLGSDISVRALARARRGLYSRWSLRATTEEQAKRYFEPAGREYRLIGRIRKQVRFMQHSLTAASYPTPTSRRAGFDLILCRNVLIYFDPRATVEVGQKLAKSLSEDGWLMLGPSDPILELEEWCDRVATPCGLLYRRRHFAKASPQPMRNKWVPHRHGVRAPVRRLEPARPAPAPAPVVERHQPLLDVQTLLNERGLAVAEAGCRDLLARHPLDAALQMTHASLLFDLGKPDESERALRRALYLDRSLLVAQMLAATLAEQRGEYQSAERQYAALAQQAAALPPDDAVPLGDGLTHAALASLAAQRVHALSRGRS
jgi:chemotaxis protein methyltransferase CheR